MPRVVHDTPSKWISVISKLLALTQSGTVKWSVVHDTSTIPEGYSATQSYVTKFLDRIVRLYEYREKVYFDEERWEWDSGITMEIVDSNLHPQYTVPIEAGLRDLLLAVQYQTTGIDKFLADVDKLDVQGALDDEDTPY